MGCKYCCSYGSIEQRKAMAIHLRDQFTQTSLFSTLCQKQKAVIDEWQRYATKQVDHDVDLAKAQLAIATFLQEHPELNTK